MEYGKVYKRMWIDRDFIGLPDDAKLLWVYLLSNPHANCAGFYWLPLNYVAAELKWPMEKTVQTFAILLDKGYVKHDAMTDVILIPKWFKYNPIVSKNQGKKARAELSELPQTPLIQDFNAILDGITDGIPDGITLAIPFDKTYSGYGYGTGKESGYESVLREEGLQPKPDRKEGDSITNSSSCRQIMDCLPADIRAGLAQRKDKS